MESIKTKVCGMRDPSNINQLFNCTIDFIGFIYYQESKRFVNSLDISSLQVPDSISKVGVFVNSELQVIKDIIIQQDLDYVQLHGEENADYCDDIKQSGVGVIKAFGIASSFDWEQVKLYANTADYFLFDTKSSTYGGTGTAFNWQDLKKYDLEIPYFLSGGIGLQNLEAVTHIQDDRLFAVDINSKFETEPGIKDIQKIKEALKKLRNE